MASSILIDLKDNTKNKEQLTSFYSCSQLFNDNLEDLAVAFILIRKYINSHERPNVVYKKVEEIKHHLLFEYCEYVLDLSYDAFKNLKYLVELKKEKILNKVFENKIEFPVFKKDENGNIYKFNDEFDYDIVFIKDSKSINSDLAIDDKSLNLIPCDKQRGLYNKQPVWCWNNGCKEKQLRFYNVVSKGAYSIYNNSIFDFNFDNYKALTLEQIEILDFMMED